MSRSLLRAATCMAAIALAACSSGGESGPTLDDSDNDNDDGSEIVFFAQQTPPGAVMDARFEGRIVSDAQGCLRLDAAQPATVIWPYGFYRTGRNVRDASGRKVGKIGDSFSIGGGYSPTHDHLSLSAADHALADSRCPGEYWIVGETD